MPDIVTLERPREGIALITMSNPDINNHGSWEGVGQLGEALIEAREGGARVSVLASGTPGHWYEHAWLRDLRNTVTGEPTTGTGGGWGACLQELAKTPVVTIAAISGDCSGGGAELGWACDLRIAEEQARFGQPEIQDRADDGHRGDEPAGAHHRSHGDSGDGARRHAHDSSAHLRAGRGEPGGAGWHVG